LTPRIKETLKGFLWKENKR